MTILVPRSACAWCSAAASRRYCSRTARHRRADSQFLGDSAGTVARLRRSGRDGPAALRCTRRHLEGDGVSITRRRLRFGDEAVDATRLGCRFAATRPSIATRSAPCGTLASPSEACREAVAPDLRCLRSVRVPTASGVWTLTNGPQLLRRGKTDARTLKYIEQAARLRFCGAGALGVTAVGVRR